MSVVGSEKLAPEKEGDVMHHEYYPKGEEGEEYTSRVATDFAGLTNQANKATQAEHSMSLR